MQPRTLSALTVLEKAAWFSRVGIKDTETVRPVSSWQEAMNYCDCVDGRNFGLEAMNQIRDMLRVRAEERYNRWNDVIRDLEPVIKPMVKRKIEKVIQENDLPSEAYELMVYKSVLRSCVELEYSDVIRPGFFASVAYWYAKGHFPCGWKDVKVKGDYIDFYPPGFYDAIAKWYEAGDFGNWQGQIPPPGKLIVY